MYLMTPNQTTLYQLISTSGLEPPAKSLLVQTPTQQSVQAKKSDVTAQRLSSNLISDPAADKILIPKALCYKSLHE